MTPEARAFLVEAFSLVALNDARKTDFAAWESEVAPLTDKILPLFPL